MNSHAGAGRYTSERNARRMLARGQAVEAGGNAIRLLESEEIRAARQAQRDQQQAERYWRQVEIERLGADAPVGSLAYQLRPQAERATLPGGPGGAVTVSFLPYRVRGPVAPGANLSGQVEAS